MGKLAAQTGNHIKPNRLGTLKASQLIQHFHVQRLWIAQDIVFSKKINFGHLSAGLVRQRTDSAELSTWLMALWLWNYGRLTMGILQVRGEDKMCSVEARDWLCVESRGECDFDKEKVGYPIRHQRDFLGLISFQYILGFIWWVFLF